MSFQGFYRILCKNGHLGSSDCYSAEPEDWKCHCGESCAWWELVDQTNGYDPKSETKLKIDKPEETKMCECCGEIKVLNRETFKIPKKRGHRL